MSYKLKLMVQIFSPPCGFSSCYQVQVKLFFITVDKFCAKWSTCLYLYKRKISSNS